MSWHIYHSFLYNFTAVMKSKLHTKIHNTRYWKLVCQFCVQLVISSVFFLTQFSQACPVQNSGPQLFHWSCHWVRGILLSPASPWLHLVVREKLAASIKSPMLHSISKSLPVQSSVSFGIIIRAKIGYLFLPHLLQQVQASPLYCHLFQHSLRLKIS